MIRRRSAIASAGPCLALAASARAAGATSDLDALVKRNQTIERVLRTSMTTPAPREQAAQAD